VYDLEKHELRDYRIDDYISINTKYDLGERDAKPNGDKIKTLYGLLQQIQPDEEIRRCLLSSYARALKGVKNKHFLVLNGEGGNGKGLIDELVFRSFGEYAYKLPIKTLLASYNDSSKGPEPEMASLSYKRFVYATEPRAGVSFNTSRIKELTGDDKINARFCNANKMEVNICCSLFVECNNKPGFGGEMKDAIIRRLIDIPFPSKFTDCEEEIDNIKVFKANEYYEDGRFKEDYKAAMMWLLIDEYKKNNGEVYIPEIIKTRSLRYITETHFFFDWFFDNYEECKVEKNPDLWIRITNLRDEFALSDKHQTLTKRQQTEATAPKITKMIENNKLFKSKMESNIDTTYQGKRIKGTFLKGYRRIGKVELEDITSTT
jgi:hypothetical protein